MTSESTIVAQTITAQNPQNRPLHAREAVRAATFSRYGSADVIRIEEIERPRCGPDEVLVAVRATSLNPYDWHMMTGTPYLARMGTGWRAPHSKRLGTDVAGIVEAVGEDVTRFAVGDEVFGGATGTFAEYVCVTHETLVHKPANLSFEEAAAVPVGALAALQGLRDHGRLQPGQRVLINGASGGVGTYAVQLAKHLDAEVTGVCSTRNLELVRDLGADHVVDYSAEDFSAKGVEYDLILDNVGNRKMSDYKRCLCAHGSYVVVGGPKGRVLGPAWHMAKALFAFAFGTRRAAVFMTQQNRGDLELLRDLLASGAIRSVIDAVYPLDELAAAIQQLETGRTRGKLIVTP